MITRRMHPISVCHAHALASGTPTRLKRPTTPLFKVISWIPRDRTLAYALITHLPFNSRSVGMRDCIDAYRLLRHRVVERKEI